MKLAFAAALFSTLILLALFGPGMTRAEDGAPNGPDGSSRPVWCPLVNSPTYGGGDNTYNGSDDIDCPAMGGGGDHAFLQGNRDWTNGGDGVDYLYGYEGQDRIYGGRNGDHMEGGPGDDSIYTGCPGGCDQSGDNFANDLEGNGGNDLLAAQNGRHDFLNGGSGTNVCYVERFLDEWQNCDEVHISG